MKSNFKKKKMINKKQCPTFIKLGIVFII